MLWLSVSYITAVYCYFFVLQKLLEETQRTFQQKIQDKETELDELRETVESHKVSLEQKNSCWLLKSCLRLS